MPTPPAPPSPLPSTHFLLLARQQKGRAAMVPFEQELRSMSRYGAMANYLAPSMVLGVPVPYPVEMRGRNPFTHGTPSSGARPGDYASCRKPNAKAKRRAQKQGRKASR